MGREGREVGCGREGRVGKLGSVAIVGRDGREVRDGRVGVGEVVGDRSFGPEQHVQATPGRQGGLLGPSQAGGKLKIQILRHERE